mgnify:CR=1 FL=1
MSKIPTAEELLENYRFEAGEHIGNRDYDLMCSFAIEFAKLHVQEALETAYQKSVVEEQEIYDPLNGDSWNQYVLKEESILNSYPLENIK